MKIAWLRTKRKFFLAIGIGILVLSILGMIYVSLLGPENLTLIEYMPLFVLASIGVASIAFAIYAYIRSSNM